MPIRRSDSEENQGPVGRGQPYIHIVTSTHQLMEVARREGDQEISVTFTPHSQSFYFQRSNLLVQISLFDIMANPDPDYKNWLNLDEKQAKQIVEYAARCSGSQPGNVLYPEGTVESHIHNPDGRKHRDDEDDDIEEATIWDLI